ncbi:MAG: hypothetical protein ACE5F6_10660, partial [Anaerolineae bacterium]
MRRTFLGVVLLSAGTLAFEITLTRVFAVAQWYHFAFMAVSVALLGFGSSGTALVLWPAPARYPQRWIAPMSVAFAATVVASYLVVNHVPFDSYRIAWEPIQFIYLAVYYLALMIPFFFAGMVVGALLSAETYPVNRIYAANLAGSGLGALVALAGLTWLSPPGVVLLAAAFGLASAMSFHPASRIPHPAPRIVSLILIVALVILAITPPTVLDIRLSPYKTLSTLLRYPDTRITFTGWNAFSRVDAVESSTVRHYPGLSFGYVGPTPHQVGVTVDGDNLTPITATADEDALGFLDALPTALPYRLIDSPRTLVIEPGGGLDVLQAARLGASHVTAVERNPLIVDVVGRRYDTYSGNLYTRPEVTVVVESGRGFARRAVAAGQPFDTPAATQDGPFDLAYISLADSFKVVNFGAYSLTESSTYTVEAFRDFYRLLSDDGILVIPR